MKKVKIGVKDVWVEKAMTDDDMVAELLIRLKHAGTVVAENPVTNLPPLRWGKRKQRSRLSRFGGGVLVSLKKKKDVVDSIRASPKTPLSWSGGSGSGGGGDSASPSIATGDGFEDTSRQASCSTSTGSGSKIFHTNEITSSLSKRLKKKKSSCELKHEEKFKLKERLDLEKEIASLRATYDEQNVRNQRLKRIKLDLNTGRIELIQKSQPEENKERLVFLPDLNMPSEEEMLYGTS